jgi:hypothetical protein
MLPSLVAPPFHRAGWIYEEKYGGYRILAYKEGKRVQLLSRQGRDGRRTSGKWRTRCGGPGPRRWFSTARWWCSTATSSPGSSCSGRATAL